jgi:hypothetical protein
MTYVGKVGELALPRTSCLEREFTNQWSVASIILIIIVRDTFLFGLTEYPD